MVLELRRQIAQPWLISLTILTFYRLNFPTMKPLPFGNLELAYNVAYYNCFPFAIFLFSIAWKESVCSGLQILYHLSPYFPIYISHFAVIQVCIMSVVYQSQQENSIFIQHTLILTSNAKISWNDFNIYPTATKISEYLDPKKPHKYSVSNICQYLHIVFQRTQPNSLLKVNTYTHTVNFKRKQRLQRLKFFMLLFQLFIS